MCFLLDLICYTNEKFSKEKVLSCQSVTVDDKCAKNFTNHERKVDFISWHISLSQCEFLSYLTF